MNRLLLRKDVRSTIDDWPLTCKLMEAINDTEDLLTVAYPIKFYLGGDIQIDDEIMRVINVAGNANQVVVMRGFKGTTATSHSTDAVIQVYSRFTDTDINSKITDCFNAVFPEIYKIEKNNSLLSSSELSYDVSGFSPTVTERFGIFQVEIKYPSAEAWAVASKWYFQNQMLYFESAPLAGQSLRISYISKYIAPANDTDEAWTFPEGYTEMLKHYVVGRLQEMNLQKRIQFYQYSAQSDPDAATVGDVMGVAGYSLYQYRQLLDQFSMPMPSFNPNRRLRNIVETVETQRRPI